jgi:hypothetical protein
VTRPDSPPRELGGPVTRAQRDAITERLGALPDEFVVALRDARGHEFQRLEFLGDAVLELVVRLDAHLAGRSAADADDTTTDTALARAAEKVELDAWLEWEPSAARRADLVEACAGAVWLARGWPALVDYVNAVVYPMSMVTADIAMTGVDAIPAHDGRSREVLGASVLEVAADLLAFADPALDAEGLTLARNTTYSTTRVASRARAVSPPATATGHTSDALVRDAVEADLARTVLEAGIPTAIERATELLR